MVGGDEHYGHVLVNQCYRAVLHLGRRVAFGVYVADFFQLQRTFKSHGVVEAASHVEGVLGVGKSTGYFLYLAVFGEHGLYFAWDGGQFGYGLLVFLLRDGALLVGEGEGEERQHGNLAGESLGRGHADFRTYVYVYAGVRRPGDARAYGVDYAEAQGVVVLCQLEGGQRVGRLAALRYGYDNVAGLDDGVAVAELRGVLHLYGHLGPLLYELFAY